MSMLQQQYHTFWVWMLVVVGLMSGFYSIGVLDVVVVGGLGYWFYCRLEVGGKDIIF